MVDPAFVQKLGKMKMTVITIAVFWAPSLCAFVGIDYHEVIVMNLNNRGLSRLRLPISGRSLAASLNARLIVEL
jgi:hypothetical protein